MTQRIPTIMLDSTGANSGDVLTYSGGVLGWAAPTGGGGSSTWGSITGTLSSQTDLNTALSGKQPLATVLTNTTASFTTSLETKLSGIAAGATANSSDATLLNRANHTGSQAISTITGLQTSLDAKAALAGAAFTGAISAPNHLTTMSGWCSGKPANSEKITGAIFPVATTITQANCVAKASVAATASTVLTIKKNGSTTVGTMTFAAAATIATVSISAGSVSANDLLTVEGPATADATLADIAVLVRA